MERNNSLSIIITRNITPDKIPITDSPVTSAKKRHRSLVQLFKVALFMIRRRSSGKTKPHELASGGGNMLNRLVGSMRPLHLQSNGESPAESQPESPSIMSSSSSEMSSRYGSAANLQEMDKSESRYASAVNLRDMDIEECGEEIGAGDEMIDVKAEVFIAKFYENIRIQRLNSIDRRYNEMVERSIA